MTCLGVTDVEPKGEGTKEWSKNCGSFHRVSLDIPMKSALLNVLKFLPYFEYEILYAYLWSMDRLRFLFDGEERATERSKP
jgi:hypothetical protein